MTVQLTEPGVSNVRGALASAAVAGVIAALPVVIGIAVPNVVARLPQVLAAPAVLICPPWELFWALMGQPDNILLVLRVAALVMALNALLYAPLGPVFVLLKSRSRLLRWTVMTGTYLALMGAGHAFFFFRESIFR